MLIDMGGWGGETAFGYLTSLCLCITLISVEAGVYFPGCAQARSALGEGPWLLLWRSCRRGWVLSVPTSSN